jgi:response regulator of citrate/malate metabolism
MIRTLVVEDDPLTARAHAVYVERVPGFALSGVAGTGQEALRRVALGAVDLVLLDMNLPDMHGTEVCRAFRSHGRPVDVIAVTSARELAVVRSAVSQGVVQYLLKPFVFAALRERLERYAEYRAQVAGDGPAAGQHEIDRLMGGLTQPARPALPKGLSEASLEAVIGRLQGGVGLSAGEVAERSGMSRVAARRYLEHLHATGLAVRRSRYGGSGRPEIEYSLKD